MPTSFIPFPANTAAKDIRRLSVNSFGYVGQMPTRLLIMLPFILNYAAPGRVCTLQRPLRAGNSRTVIIHLAVGLRDLKISIAFIPSPRNPPKDSRAELFQNLAFTLNKRRFIAQWKTYTVASSSSVQDIVQILEKKDTTVAKTLSSRTPKLGFIFTGQGAQWPAMGIELFEAYGIFRQSVESADAYLRDKLNYECSKEKSKIGIAIYSQPLYTVLQVVLIDLLKDWKIIPQLIVGHSFGEIAAVYCMGAFSRESAWMLAYFKGTLFTTFKQVAPDI
ncbi:uncharacterized protein PgNI_02609 [Pyricularia grisea]|uniref:Malonyl-CoA:ACP transacylase (MAT) domain-containing protein n=1 Tax=Pyricularia grisea TaxID=148305 RepID=A0A6P8BHR4_PYRGI|nr:uncharacterized protein PgNI_02609 [Pyricularia grisea]TLD16313.1 hypothetical protein PgNI_02609 [Pyricularia grisea]